MRRSVGCVSTMAGCCTRWTLPTLLWCLFSLASAALCSLGLYFSNWLQRDTKDGTINSASSFRLCLNESAQISVSCDSYFTFGEIFSLEWQAVTILMGLGACLLVFTSLISLFTLCAYRYCNKCLVCMVAVLQCLGVLLFIAAIVVFPLGIDNEMVQHPDLCGESAGSYKLGNCTFGWAYITVITGTTLGLFAVVLSWTPIMCNRKNNDRGSYAL